MEFIAEQGGGTLMIETNQPPTYNTHFKANNNQFVLELLNSELPSKWTRPFNTKDFQSNIAFVKAYQSENGNTNVVIQLRDGRLKPNVKVEGNVLLVFTDSASSTPGAYSAKARKKKPQTYSTHNSSQGRKILSAHSLQEFLASNNRFHGKRISIITKQMRLKDFFNFIAEESGINLVLSKQISGEVSLKLRNIPWDQALVVVMKSNNLGYTRHGNVLRIAPLSVLRSEEEEAQKLFISRKKIEPLHVFMIPVSYANVDTLTTKLKQFLSPRGKIVGDSLTSSLIITDTKDNLEKVQKLVKSLDIPPPQVFIEGRVVEAKSTFTRKIGVNWGITPAEENGKLTGGFEFARDGSGANQNIVNLNPRLNITPGGGATSGDAFYSGFNVGTFSKLGNIQAFLSLNERTDEIKIISSPRIMAMNNEKASINQKTESAVITSVNDGGVVSQNVTFRPVNLKLDVIPQITSDNSVLLKIDVTREFLGSVIGGTTLRPINSRSAKTKILVKNGDTAVIGGILQSDVTRGETGVPFLRRIPILGALFRTKSNSKDKTELLIFLTPKIIPSPSHSLARGGKHETEESSDPSEGPLEEKDFPEGQTGNTNTWQKDTQENSNSSFQEGQEEPIMYEQSQ